MTWSGTSSILVLVFLSVSLQHNNAATLTKLEDHANNQETNAVTDSIDEDVLELEQLKHSLAANSRAANTKEEILPQLEKQLEDEARASASIVSSSEDGSDDDNDDDDTDVDSNDGGTDEAGDTDYGEKLAKASEQLLLKTLAEYHHKKQQFMEQHMQDEQHHVQAAGDAKPIDSKDDNSELVKMLHGAERLTFGQQFDSETTTPTIPKSTKNPQLEEISNAPEGSTLTSNGQRRRDNAEVLLRHSGGQYSAFDMAQYVFWTGDESGVARAVEELIQQGVMTRENAIKFLRDIRLGVEYLQNTYSSRPLKLTENHAKTTLPAITDIPTTQPSPQTEAAPTDGVDDLHGKIAPEILKVIERLPSLLKLNDQNEPTETTQDYDDVVGRLRLADFLYAEYSLEEVIYQLSKVMFTQSLTRGSEPAQRALQKLTAFLETEGTHGRISPVLQRKILDVLLAALADTLAENPELTNAARSALGKHMDKITQRHSQDKY
ncbi:uncharacterized protein LOC129763547 [Toxorhynchites rutilus septentrionalis]|uniref:uncharacterized protein LOC129763547 n=1 Tax=Toxorhynchites rutilus septentrionalis TaxID=329112 RepID=UPI00247B1E6B|nr:uncharacterized protein LOC129763547 [Toxorhynchites rutilus septentrionalis]